MRKPGKGLFALLVMGIFIFLALPAYAQDEDTGATEEVEKVTDIKETIEREEVEDITLEVSEEATLEDEETGEDILSATDVEDDFENELELKEAARKAEASSHFTKASIAREGNNLQEAIIELLKASELDPDNEGYIELLQLVRQDYVNELLNEKDYELAVDIARKHMDQFPEDTTMKNMLMRAEGLKEGVSTETVTDLEKEPPVKIIKDVRTSKELYNAAEEKYYLKEYEEAFNLLMKAVELGPDKAADNRIRLLLFNVNEKRQRYQHQLMRARMNEYLMQVTRTWTKRERRKADIPIGIEGPPIKTTSPSRKKIEEKLDTIIPRVEFSDAKLKEVIDYLSKKVDVSIVIDEAVFRGGPVRGDFNREPEFGPGGGGFNGSFGPNSMMNPGGGMGSMGSGPPGGAGAGFGPDPGFVDDSGFGGDPGFTDPGTTITPPVDQGGITIRLQNIPLKAVLKYVLRQKNLKYVVDDYAIVVMRRGDTLEEDLVTEIFRLATSGVGVSRNLIQSGGTSAGSGFGGAGGGGFGSGVGGGGASGFGSGVGLGPGTGLDTGSMQNIETFLRNSSVQWPRYSSLIYHEPTATLIVKNTPTNLALIRELVRIWDQPPMQVEIEARFVEVQMTKQFENTFQIGMTNAISWARESDLMRGMPINSMERITTLFDPRNSIRTAESVLGTSGGNILQISGILTGPEFSIIWHALDQNQFSELLNAPRVCTISGQQAQIQVVEELRYPTEFEVETLEDIFVDDSSVDFTGFSPFFVTPQSFETREVGTLLTVTPNVSADGKVIRLVLFPEVSELLGWDIYGGALPTGDSDDSNSGTGFTGLDAPQPRFGSRNISTTVDVSDGETIVLGGLITERTARYKDKVPILGSIPLLGRLFRTELDDTYKRNLIIFVTARLITSRGTELKEERRLTEILEARYESNKPTEDEQEGMLE